MDNKTKLPLLSGNKIPVIGLGTWDLTDNTADVIVRAIELGYPMIDTSGDYGSQPGIAEGLKQSCVNRDDIYIVTKVEETEDAYESTKKNLGELQLDHADLMLIHRPPKSGAGEELWRGLIRARDEGLAKDIGVSNYAPQQIQALSDATGVMPAVNQIEWTPFGWNRKMHEFCNKNRIVIQAYSPLTHGNRVDDGTLRNLIEKYDKTQAQILIRWCLQVGTVPLPKANQIAHLEENIDVFDFEIADEDMEYLNSLNEDYSALANKPIYEKNMEKEE